MTSSSSRVASSPATTWRPSRRPGWPDVHARGATRRDHRVAGAGIGRSGVAGRALSDGHRPAEPQPGVALDLFEYQGKQLFARYGIPISAGDGRLHRRRGGRGRRRHRLPGRGQGPGARRRARQGRRREARRRRRRVPHPRRRTSSAWTSRATWSSWSGSSRPATSPRSTTRRSRSTAPPSSTSACSPPRAASRSRRSRTTNPDAIARIQVDPVDGLTATAVPRNGSSAAGLDPDATDGTVDILQKLCALLRGRRRRPRGDQPADPHARRAWCTRSTPR